MICLKNILTLNLLLFIIVLFVGCSGTIPETANSIVPPENKSVPLQGEWVVDKCLFKTRANVGESRWIGKTVEFSPQAAVLGATMWRNVSYKTKRVNAGEYFLYKVKTPVEELGINEKDVFVITVSSDDKFVCEVIKISDNELLFDFEGELLCLKKAYGKELDKAEEENGKGAEVTLQITGGDGRLPRSGLLLGIRTPSANAKGTDSRQEEYYYRTLWIASHNMKIKTVLQADGLFLPRKSGFWKLDVQSISRKGKEEDLIAAHSVADDGADADELAEKSAHCGSDYSEAFWNVILFEVNDYVSVDFWV